MIFFSFHLTLYFKDILLRILKYTGLLEEKFEEGEGEEGLASSIETGEEEGEGEIEEEREGEREEDEISSRPK